MFIASFCLMILSFTSNVGAKTLPLTAFSVCPASVATFEQGINSAQCRQASLEEIDPQGRALWVRARIDVSSLKRDKTPLGLYVSGTTSSEVFVNGVPIGTNGTPATTRSQETPGRMDAVFYIPNAVLRDGENEVTLRLSAFHNIIHLKQPIHWITIGPYEEPIDLILRVYWPSLVTFGVLFAGALFFASAAISSVRRTESLILSLLSLIAAVQLYTEVYRGLFGYLYPFHEVRLILLTGLSAVFGLTLGALIVTKFLETRRWLFMAALGFFIVLPLILVDGFDAKASFALLMAAMGCGLMTGRLALKGNRAALVATIMLIVFCASILFFPDLFLNTLFYYEVAAALLILFVLRAISFERAAKEHELERIRAHDLEMALSLATPSGKSTVRVNDKGAIHVIDTSEITLCKGADDYVELCLIDGRTLLHSGALSDLEMSLPANFLRVHRSFIVNTAFVKKLVREATGTGLLTLSNGAQAPVSRRIMPKVRTALA